jgi:hypothetical protein
MAELGLAPDALRVKLSFGEKLAALHGDVSVPWSKVRGAQVLDRKWWQQLGLRVPGTAVPGLIIAGTYVWRADKAFVYWRRGQQVIQINLDDAKYTRIVLGVADAELAADQVNTALTGC